MKHVIDLSHKVRVRGGQLMDTALHGEVVATTCTRLHASVEVLPDGMVRPLARLSQGPPLQGAQIVKDFASIARSSIDRGEMDVLLNVATVHLTLAHYRNQLLHLFVEDMVLAAALQGEAEEANKGEKNYLVVTYHTYLEGGPITLHAGWRLHQLFTKCMFSFDPFWGICVHFRSAFDSCRVMISAVCVFVRMLLYQCCLGLSAVCTAVPPP